MVQLVSKPNAGRSVGFMSGRIQFDGRGRAEFDATRDEVERFRNLGWLADPNLQAEPGAEPTKADVEETRKTVHLVSKANAGRSVGYVGCRIQFDGRGQAEFEATPKDVERFQNLGWLAAPPDPEDEALLAKRAKVLEDAKVKAEGAVADPSALDSTDKGLLAEQLAAEQHDAKGGKKSGGKGR